MNRMPPEAAAELREILSRRPEPPPYYHHKGVSPWEEELGRWRVKGLRVRQDAARSQTWVELYGQPVPGTLMSRQPDGSIHCRNWDTEPDDPPPPDWTPPLELPGSNQDLDKFLEDNHCRQDPDARWPLLRLVSNHIRQLLTQDPDLDLRSVITAASSGGIGRRTEKEWIAAATAQMDPKALTRLRRWTGHDIKRNLQNYNLAMKCGAFLEEMSQANPGAVAWWYAGRRRRKERQDRLRHRYNAQAEGPPPPWLAAPAHPGEIIAQAKREFHEADGGNAGWKALTAQPATHVADLLKKESRESAVWVAETLAAANLPEAEPDQDPRKPKAVQQSLLATPARPRVQPPAEVKLLMARLAKRTIAPGRELDARRHYLVGLSAKLPKWPERDQEDIRRGLRRMGELAFKHFAGSPPSPNKPAAEERQRQFNHIADYVFAEPQAAARATAWTGLLKASAEWHSEARLRREREDLAEVTKLNFHLGGPWEENVYFQTLDSPAGFTARLLQSAAELIEEAETLQHCVGSIQYARWCADGYTRLFRLEPAGAPPGATPRTLATTVELAKHGEHEFWEIGQHTGWRNRPPTDREKRWADELVRQWNQAEINATALSQPRKAKRKA